MRVDTKIKSSISYQAQTSSMFYILYAYTTNMMPLNILQKGIRAISSFFFLWKIFKNFFFLFFCKLATYIKNTANKKRRRWLWCREIIFSIMWLQIWNTSLFRFPGENKTVLFVIFSNLSNFNMSNGSYYLFERLYQQL